MLGSTPLISVLGAVTPDLARADETKLASFFKSATEYAGLSLLFIEHGTKFPADHRTDRQKKADDEAGLGGGWNLATHDPKILLRYAMQYRKSVEAKELAKVDARETMNSTGAHHPDYVTALTHRDDIAKQLRKTVTALRKGIVSTLDGVDDASMGILKTAHNKVLKALRDHDADAYTQCLRDDEWDAVKAINPASDDLANAVDNYVSTLYPDDSVPGTDLAVEWVSAVNAVDSLTTTVGPDSPDAAAARETAQSIAAVAPLGFAMELGGSRVIVVDADTGDEVDAFRNYWYDKTGDPAVMYTSPTVTTPGVQESDGSWRHSNGGHFYFPLPDEYDIPDDAPNKIKITHVADRTSGRVASFVIMIKNCFVLIPPTERIEGTYDLVGPDYPMPEWMRDVIGAEARQRREKRESREKLRAAADAGDPDALDQLRRSDSINDWGETRSWASILEPMGWTTRGRTDKCGCTIFAAPGKASGSRSATAHDLGCEFDADSGGRLHVWTTDPGGSVAALMAKNSSQTFSKLQVIAQDQYQGNIGVAMGELGIGDRRSSQYEESMAMLDAIMSGKALPGHDDSFDDDEDDDSDDSVSEESEEVSSDQALFDKINTLAAMPSEPVDVGGDNVEADGSAEDLTGAFRSEMLNGADDVVSRVPEMRPFSEFRFMEPPKYIIDQTLEEKGFLAINGASGTGKTFLAIDCALSLVTGQPWLGFKTKQCRVGYVAGEGATGAMTRVRAWEAARLHDPRIMEAMTSDELTEMIDNDFVVVNQAYDLHSIFKNADKMRRFFEIVRDANVDVLILDTWARSIPGVDENSAQEVGSIISLLDALRRFANCAVMVIHHTSRDTTHGRGSTALKGALDSELLIREIDRVEGDAYPGKPLEITVTKQKNVAEWPRPRVACITELPFPDPLGVEEEEVYEYFGPQEKSVSGWSCVTDVEGNVSVALGNYQAWDYLDDSASSSQLGLMSRVSDREVCEGVYRAVRDMERAGATKPLITSYLSETIFAEEVSEYMTVAVTRALSTCIVAGVLMVEKNLYTVNPHYRDHDTAMERIDTFVGDPATG